MTGTSASKKKQRDGNSASIDLSSVKDDFEKLKKHCQDQAPWSKHNNSDIVRFAIIHAAKNL
jgi:hypothetical protein